MEVKKRAHAQARVPLPARTFLSPLASPLPASLLLPSPPHLYGTQPPLQIASHGHESQHVEGEVQQTSMEYGRGEESVYWKGGGKGKASKDELLGA